MEISCLLISTDTGVPITGGSASTALKIRRVADNALYDWNDATFKTSGWTTPTTTLTELTTVAGEYAKTVSESSWNDGYYQTIITYTGSIPQLHFTGEAYIYDGKEFEPANDAQISGVENKVDTVDGNVDDIETLLNTVDGKVDTIDTVVDRIEIDTTSIESKVDIVDTVVDRIEVDTTSIESKVDIIDTNVDSLLSMIGGSGLYVVTLQLYETSTTTPLSAVHVAAYAGSDLEASGDTNTSGKVVFHLDAGIYAMRYHKAGVTFSVTDTITITGDATVTRYGTPVAIPVPSSGSACTLYDFCYDQSSGSPMASVTATARITALPYNYDGKLHTGASVTGTYSAVTGLLYWDIAQGATVLVTIEEVGVIRERVIIPAQGSVRLGTLLSNGI